jgi:hypothetical protein
MITTVLLMCIAILYLAMIFSFSKIWGIYERSITGTKFECINKQIEDVRYSLSRKK